MESLSPHRRPHPRGTRVPVRLVPFGTVPLPADGARVAGLEHCATTLGFKGVQVLTNIAGAELSDPRFAAFWAAAERLDLLVVVHPAGYTQPERFRRFYFDNAIGNPLDPRVPCITRSSVGAIGGDNPRPLPGPQLPLLRRLDCTRGGLRALGHRRALGLGGHRLRHRVTPELRNRGTRRNLLRVHP